MPDILLALLRSVGNAMREMWGKSARNGQSPTRKEFCHERKELSSVAAGPGPGLYGYVRFCG